MWLSVMKAITLELGLSFHDSYEFVTRDELVVVAESDDLVRAVVSTGVRLDLVSVSASRMVTMLWLFVVFALVWPRPVYAYVAHRGGDLRGKGLCSLALPARSGVSGTFFSQIARSELAGRPDL